MICDDLKLEHKSKGADGIDRTLSVWKPAVRNLRRQQAAPYQAMPRSTPPSVTTLAPPVADEQPAIIQAVFPAACLPDPEPENVIVFLKTTTGGDEDCGNVAVGEGDRVRGSDTAATPRDYDTVAVGESVGSIIESVGSIIGSVRSGGVPLDDVRASDNARSIAEDAAVAEMAEMKAAAAMLAAGTEAKAAEAKATRAAVEEASIAAQANTIDAAESDAGRRAVDNDALDAARAERASNAAAPEQVHTVAVCEATQLTQPADPPNLQKGVQKVTTTRNQTTQKSPSPRVPCTAARSKSNGRTSHKRRPSRPISHSDENHYDWVNSKRRVWGVQWTDAIGVLLKENEPGPRQHLRVEQRVRQLDGHA